MTRKRYRWIKKQLLKVLRVEIPPSIEPLVASDAVLLGQPLRLLTHRQDSVLGTMIRGGKQLPYDLAELAWLLQNIQPGDFVLDAGGNMGYVSISMALKQPDATVVAFEPDPLNYGLLQMNMVLNHVNNVRAFNLALGNEDGLIHFYRSPKNFGDHRSAKPKGEDCMEAEFEKLSSPVLRVSGRRFISEVFPERQFDLVKIDTQGADFEILGNILPLLQPMTKVSIEFSPYHLAANGTTREEIVRVLSEFRCIEIVLPDPDRLFRTEKTDVEYLARYFDDGFKRYQTYHNLVLRN